MKHEFRDELRIKVDHDHKIPTEKVDQIVDKVVDGAVTIIGALTVAHLLRKWLT